MRLLVLLAAALSVYSQTTVTTFAGGVIRSGVPAQNVYLDNIAALAWDPAGNVVFCDRTNNVIRRVRTDGILETIAGTGVTGFAGDGGRATAALLNIPNWPVYDSAGNLYFSDDGNFRIRRIDSKGIITTVAGNGTPTARGTATSGPALERSISPAGLTISPSGKVYFQDGLRVRILTSDGQLQDYVSLPSIYPTWPGLTSDSTGNLYVTQSDGFHYAAILRIASDGNVATLHQWTATAPPWVEGLRSLAGDAKGNVYAIKGSSIVRFNPDGAITVVASAAGTCNPPSRDGSALPSVANPFALAIDAHGNIAFADAITTGGYLYGLTLIEVGEITADSKLQYLAGNAPQVVPDGTPLLSAWFEGLSAIAFSPTGDMYVADYNACQIRKIGADGVLSTFAGTGHCAYSEPSGPNAKTADIVPPGSIAVNSQNRVWVADASLNIYSIAQDGSMSPMFHTTMLGGIGRLAIDAKDRVYVLATDSLSRVLADGSSKLIAPNFRFNGIGADAFANIYFLSDGYLYIVNDSGTVYMDSPYPSYGSGSLLFDSAHRAWYVRQGSAISSTDDIYIVDHGNRIGKDSSSAATLPTPAIAPGGVVNAASYAGGAISPGELISIFGSNFGADRLEIASPSGTTYPATFGPTTVLFNGTPGAITAIAPNQINVFVPPGVPSGATASVLVKVGAITSQTVSLPVAAATPGIFTADASGSGQGAILNQDGSINSTSHPEARGNIVSIFGTGLGLTTPPSAVNVAIGGQPAEVLYAGAAPSLAPGVFQINARIPAATAPGNAAVSVTAAGVASAGHPTVAVK